MRTTILLAITFIIAFRHGGFGRASPGLCLGAMRLHDGMEDQ